jgi:hypothetical protein
MQQNKRMIGILATSNAVLILVAMFAGCTSNQTQNQSTGNVILGTWHGTTHISGSYQRNNTTEMTVSQVTFRDNDVELTLETPQGSLTRNYTYAFTENTLVLQPVFSGGSNPFGGSYNGTRSWNGTTPWNGTRPPRNGTRPWNGTAPPFNGTIPWNGTRLGNGSQFPEDRRSLLELTLTYSWDEQTQTLYLNGAPFTKVQ